MLGAPKIGGDKGGADASGSSGGGGLFAGMATPGRRLSRESSIKSLGQAGPADPELFQKFMATPDAGQLKKAVKQFLARTQKELAAGTSDAEAVATSLREFMEGAVNWLYDRDILKTATDATIEYARDALEKGIMNKLHPKVFPPTAAEAAEDAALYRRCELLSFLTPTNLGVPASCNNNMVFRLAMDELSRVNNYITPLAKLDCIVKCCDILFRSLNLSRGADNSRPGADEFLPAFIYVTLHANVRHVLANAKYIERFRFPGGLMSKSGYCFANFQSALQFLMRVDHSCVEGITKEEFDAKLKAAAEGAPGPSSSAASRSTGSGSYSGSDTGLGDVDDD